MEGGNSTDNPDLYLISPDVSDYCVRREIERAGCKTGGERIGAEVAQTCREKRPW